jgi:hypothetical protein
MKRNKLIFLSAASSIMFFIILVFLGKHLSAQDWSKPNTPEIEIGYRIAIEIGNNRPIIRKVRSKENLKKVIDLYFPKSDIDISEFIGNSTYFEVCRTQYSFHVQTMRINKRGKYRKLRRKEIKQIENKINGSF